MLRTSQPLVGDGQPHPQLVLRELRRRRDERAMAADGVMGPEMSIAPRIVPVSGSCTGAAAHQMW
jgi:hypothetical protein